MSENRLLNYVYDKELIEYYYLNLTLEELFDKMHTLKFTLSTDKNIVPFNAQLRDYQAAIDSENNKWLVKKVEKSELFDHALFEVAYYIDFLMQTLASPTMLANIDGVYYRATKLVLNAMQIGSYNYMENPFKKVLSNDLINRWLFFDEDRNPNNYMVIHNSKKEPLIVAIDYNKADLKSTEMKITGNEDKFGWFRHEKTRFLTLLKPENFEKFTIDNFEHRLTLMMNIDLNRLRNIVIKLLQPIFEDYESKTDLVISNIKNRREYINNYFRRFFTEKIENKNDSNNDYSGLGKAFLKIYKEK